MQPNNTGTTLDVGCSSYAQMVHFNSHELNKATLNTGDPKDQKDIHKPQRKQTYKQTENT